MQVKELKHDGLSHELEVKIPANDIDKRVEARLQEVGKTIRIPGFRQGKAPMAILKQKYGRAIMGEVLEAAVNETSAQALQDKGIRPAMQPKIEVKEFDDGKDLIYVMEVEELPKIKLMDLKSLKLEKPVSKPSDKSIQDTLERLAQNNETSVEVTSGRASKKGDTLVIDFHGRTADDNVAHDGMHMHGHHLKLGSGAFIPGFEDQLIGKKSGEKVEVRVTFPETYGASELAGREAIFDVEINQIREPGEAKMDDNFAESLGMENMDALKNAISEQTAKELGRQSRMAVKRTLLDLLDEGHKFTVPQGMLDLEFQNIRDQIKMERQQRGDKDTELSKDEEKEYKSISERRVRLGLVLSEIGSENNITISDPELQKAVISEAQKYPGQEKEVFDYFSQNRQALESLRAPLYEEKVVDFILELADVKEKEVTAEELLALLEGDGEEAEAKPKKKKAASKSKSADSAEKAEKKAPAKKKPSAKKKAS